MPKNERDLLNILQDGKMHVYTIELNGHMKITDISNIWKKKKKDKRQQHWEISWADEPPAPPHADLEGGWCFPLVKWLEQR